MLIENMMGEKQVIYHTKQTTYAIGMPHLQESARNAKFPL